MKLAIAAWKKAVCVRRSQPLAASCGKSRIGSEPPVVPPATITKRDAEDVAGQERRHERRQAERQRFALDDPERREAEDEIERRVGQEEVRRRNAEHLEIEQERRAEQRGAAHRAIDADDPQDPAGGLGLRHRRRRPARSAA